MRTQIPLGPENEKCHLSGRTCSEACYDAATKCKCVMWNEFHGKDATGNEFHGWYCGAALQLNLLLEIAKEVRQGAAETSALRGEVDRQFQTRIAMGVGNAVRHASGLNGPPQTIQAIPVFAQ